MRRSVHCPVAVALLVALCAVLCFGQVYAATTGSSGREHNQATTPAKTKSLQEIENWRVYPVRSQDEAAVIEWGHSAIISALDAAVAYFGPQTAQAALLEVETTPVLADPVNGVWEDDENDAEGTTKHSKGVVRKLNNADEVHGNVVVMTDTGVGDSIISSGDGSGSGMNTLTGLDLALMAQASGAAALIVVHVDDERPDDTYRLQVPFVVPDVADDASFSVEYNKRRALEAAGIDIPVVVISLASANVLTTATVTAEMQQEDIVNNGMPDR